MHESNIDENKKEDNKDNQQDQNKDNGSLIEIIYITLISIAVLLIWAIHEEAIVTDTIWLQHMDSFFHLSFLSYIILLALLIYPIFKILRKLLIIIISLIKKNK